MDYRILCSTKGLSRQEWLRARQSGIGGSEAAAIINKSKYSSPLKVYLDKTTPITDETPDIQSEAMRQGKDLEEYCASRFEELKGKKVRRVNAIVQHPKYDFIIGDLDRRVDGENSILECKTTKPYTEAAKAYQDGKVPPEYAIQCYHYMLVTGADKCYLAALVLGMGFHVIEIDRDQEILDLLLEREIEFWEKYVKEGTPPEWDGSEAASEILKERYPEVQKSSEIELKAITEADIKSYNELNGYIKDLEARREAIKQRILDEMAEAEVGVLNGEPVARRIWVSGRETIDTKKLKAEKPEVFSAYAKQGAGYARLEIGGKN
jgi:putative phage-type endonuclease